MWACVREGCVLYVKSSLVEAQGNQLSKYGRTLSHLAHRAVRDSLKGRTLNSYACPGKVTLKKYICSGALGIWNYASHRPVDIFMTVRHELHLSTSAYTREGVLGTNPVL